MNKNMYQRNISLNKYITYRSVKFGIVAQLQT
jgi:hypothetical protein